PLADFIEQNLTNASADLPTEAAKFVNTEAADDLKVNSAEEALAGARDIIAERISDHAEARAAIRKLVAAQGTVTSKVMFGKEEDKEAAKFRDYFDWNEPLKSVPSHRMLAMRRGEKEGFLIMRITAPEADAIRLLEVQFVKGNTSCSKQMSEAVQDGY